jgi:iron(III) transport system permease protein
MITRQRGVSGRLMEIVAFLPLAIPSVIFAVGAISLGLAAWSFIPIYGTIWLIILVEVVVRLSIATRITNGAMLQIHKRQRGSSCRGLLLVLPGPAGVPGADGSGIAGVA